MWSERVKLESGQIRAGFKAFLVYWLFRVERSILLYLNGVLKAQCVAFTGICWHKMDGPIHM